MNKCPDCNQDFSRKDVMLRHRRSKHKEINGAYPHPPPPPPPSNGAYPPPPPPPPSQSNGAYPPPPPPPQSNGAYPPPQGQSMTELKHPYTVLISGPTACGKTTFVKDLLQNHRTKIQPNIQRIVWLYRRWQPLYTVIQRTVSPRVEFIQGIPSDLEDDEYFDPILNNLLVLDDLFSEAGKDKRITDLFTEGSHHRSLSVISINQNLFGNKDPTQRRNSHYLVLFDNPVDRQCVMTLARQMYPGHTEKFTKAFEKATKYPYGYLLVDLKPFTPEDRRLKSVMNEELKHESGTHRMNQPIKEDTVPETNHLSVGTQTVNIGSNPSEENIFVDNMADKGHSCDDCGVLFDTTHDVQRHVKSGKCPEHMEPPTKKMKLEDVLPREHLNMEEDVDDNEGFLKLWQKAKANGQPKYEKMYEQYMSEGEAEDDAREMATERMEYYDQRSFFRLYEQLLDDYFMPLRTCELHRQIVSEINVLRGKGVSLTSAVKRVLRKHKPQFENLFNISDDDSDGYESDNESDLSSEAESDMDSE